MTSVDNHEPGAGQPDPADHPTAEGPRPLRQRKAEALRRLSADRDVWVATADPAGVPCLVPLSFWWDGHRCWLATRSTNPTGRNLLASGLVRLCFGDTRDVVLVEGTARAYTLTDVPAEAAEGFAVAAAWDPRRDHPSYRFFAVTPAVVLAWGTVAEMRDRDLMRDGVWLL